MLVFFSNRPLSLTSKEHGICEAVNYWARLLFTSDHSSSLRFMEALPSSYCLRRWKGKHGMKRISVRPCLSQIFIAYRFRKEYTFLSYYRFRKESVYDQVSAWAINIHNLMLWKNIPSIHAIVRLAPNVAKNWATSGSWNWANTHPELKYLGRTSAAWCKDVI